MLTDLTNADKFVKLFYEELEKSDFCYYRSDSFDHIKNLIESMRKDCGDKWADNEIKKEKKEEESKNRKEAKKMARYIGLDKFGMKKVEKRIPAIFYYQYNPEEMEVRWIQELDKGFYNQYKKEFKLEDQIYHIGINHETLETFVWNHGGGGEGLYNPRNDTSRWNRQPEFNIRDDIRKTLNVYMMDFINGVLYYGFDKNNTPLLYLFIDSTAHTDYLLNNVSLVENFQKTAKRFGIDELFVLSAKRNLLAKYGVGRRVGNKVRLDVSDSKIVNLVVNKIEDAMNKEVWHRQTTMYAIQQGWIREKFRKISHVYSDNGKGICKYLRLHSTGQLD